MEAIDVTTYFKKSGEDVRVVIAHSTEDDLGQNVVNLLVNNLQSGVKVIKSQRIANFSELLDLFDHVLDFNVLLLVAHGNNILNTVKLYDDVDKNGRPMRVNVAQLKLALQDHVTDKLCLFGVCHFGTDNLAEAVCNEALALACVAPKAGYSILGTDVSNEFAALLNKIQSRKSNNIGVNELEEVMQESMSATLIDNLDVSFH